MRVRTAAGAEADRVAWHALGPHAACVPLRAWAYWRVWKRRRERDHGRARCSLVRKNALGARRRSRRRRLGSGTAECDVHGRDGRRVDRLQPASPVRTASTEARSRSGRLRRQGHGLCTAGRRGGALRTSRHSGGWPAGARPARSSSCSTGTAPSCCATRPRRPWGSGTRPRFRPVCALASPLPGTEITADIRGRRHAHRLCRLQLATRPHYTTERGQDRDRPAGCDREGLRRARRRDGARGCLSRRASDRGAATGSTADRSRF